MSRDARNLYVALDMSVRQRRSLAKFGMARRATRGRELMNRRSFSSRLLKLGVFTSFLSKLPRVVGAVGTQPLNHDPSAAEYAIKADNLTVHLDSRGRIVGADIGPKKSGRALTGETVLEGCNTDGPVSARRLEGGGVEFSSRLLGPDQRQCNVVQRFLAGQGSVRWEIEISIDGAPWTTPITTTLKWPAAAQAGFWTAWMHGDEKWEDPLEPRPFAKASWDYGPYFGKGITIPLASVLESQSDTGLSLVLSPEDTFLNVTLSTEADGAITFRRLNHRLGNGRTVKFAADLVPHEADWRGGLRWMTNRYRAYFDPPVPKATQMAGTAAYSHWDGPIDAAKLKRMSFGFVWETCWDAPYFGMYYPPVGNDEGWAGQEIEYDANAGCRFVRIGGAWTQGASRKVTYRLLNERARRLHEGGFYYLAFFCTSGYCPKFQITKPLAADLPDKDLWTDPVTQLRRKLADGIWRDKNGKESYVEGEDSLVMDPAAPNYQAFILDQMRRCVEQNAEADGVCFDRQWWASGQWAKNMVLEPVNWGADDGEGWYDGRPGRHFSGSFKEFLSKLGPVMHGAGKVIFYNSCMAYRLDCYRNVDGFFDEAWPENAKRSFPNLNGVALLAVRKPATLWTVDSSWIKDDPDAFFQRHLLMGVYPSAPYPQNDHLVLPDRWLEERYMEYGPLMDAMRGKKWALEPHCIEIEGHEAKANLFAVIGGWVAPITFGPKEGTVKVILRNLPGLTRKLHCEALLPGEGHAQAVQTFPRSGSLELRVPLKRGCSMVKITKGA